MRRGAGVDQQRGKNNKGGIEGEDQFSEGGSVRRGSGALLRSAEAPHVVDGIGMIVSAQPSEYTHPVIFTGAPALSFESYQPEPPTIFVPFLAVYVGAGSVGTGEPVAVYMGKRAASVAPPGRPESDAGGQAWNDETKVGAMVPAPFPPVAVDGRGPSKGSELPHDPSDERGSKGIQPSWRPSWYDHIGDSTWPVIELFPIFQVQKNQCGRASMED